MKSGSAKSDIPGNTIGKRGGVAHSKAAGLSRG